VLISFWGKEKRGILATENTEKIDTTEDTEDTEDTEILFLQREKEKKRLWMAI